LIGCKRLICWLSGGFGEMSLYQTGAEVTWHAPSWRKNVLLLFLWLYQVMTNRAVLGCGERNVPAAARDGGQRFIGRIRAYVRTTAWVAVHCR